MKLRREVGISESKSDIIWKIVANLTRRKAAVDSESDPDRLMKIYPTRRVAARYIRLF